MRYIKDYEEGNKIQGVYYCKQKNSTETKTGKPYDSVLLQDKTGVLDAKVWDPYSQGIGEYEAGDYIDVIGDIKIFNNQKQASLVRIRKADEGEYDTKDYFPMTEKNVDEMFAKIIEYIDSIKNPYYKKLLESFFKDNNVFVTAFKSSSAAKTVHHGFIGGLLEHTLGVTNMCNYLASAYPLLSRDLLITAAICHDIGKTKEISPFPANEYTDEGQLLGHIVMGCEMVGNAADKIEGFPPKYKHELQHCILAHHGEYEFGSPKKPAIMEAVALNFADNTDAKMQSITEMFKSKDTNDWLGFNKFLDSNFRKTTGS